MRSVALAAPAYNNRDRINFETVAAQAQGCVWNAMVVGSIPTRGNELLFINILISSLWQQGYSPVLSSATQQAIPRKI